MVQELKKLLSTLRNSMHTVVTDIFSYDADGSITDAKGQLIGDGSKIESG